MNCSFFFFCHIMLVLRMSMCLLNRGKQLHFFASILVPFLSLFYTIHISLYVMMIFSSIPWLIVHNVSGIVAIDKALRQNHSFLSLVKLVLIHLHPCKWQFTTDWLPVSAGNKSQYGGVALTRDRPFSPIPLTFHRPGSEHPHHF